MTKYYDRDGKPMSMKDWGMMFSDMEYKRVAQTELPNGAWVSTVWLGMDHSFGFAGSPPLIFETMVFRNKPREMPKTRFEGPFEDEGWSELDCNRYSTEEEALAGHAAMVEKYSHVAGWDPETKQWKIQER